MVLLCARGRDEGSCKSRALQFLLEVRNELTRRGKQELFVQFQETLTAFNEGRCVQGRQGLVVTVLVPILAPGPLCPWQVEGEVGGIQGFAGSCAGTPPPPHVSIGW